MIWLSGNLLVRRLAVVLYLYIILWGFLWVLDLPAKYELLTPKKSIQCQRKTHRIKHQKSFDFSVEPVLIKKKSRIYIIDLLFYIN